MNRTSIFVICIASSLYLAQESFAEGARRNTVSQGTYGAKSDRQAVVGDGQGNAVGVSRQAFETDTGARGIRMRRFSHAEDGSMSASGWSNASGSNVAAERSGSYTRDASGNASAQRSTTVTNSNTGVTYDGGATYSTGSGLSRSGSCTDTAGSAISCGPRR